MIILGVVLITTGLPRNGAVVGEAPPTCGEVNNVVGAVASCPEGTINITKVDVPPNGPPTPQATWSVDISTTNCVLPQGGTSETVTVPDKGTGSSTPLFIYTDVTSRSQCVYTLAEEPVAGWSPSFDPPSPVTIPFDNTSSDSHEDVTLTNTSTVTPTPTPTHSTVSPSPTPTVTHHSASPSSKPTHSAGALPTSSTAPATLPRTGPSAPVGASVYAGVALCLLGLFLAAVPGRRRRRPDDAA
jgi:hypothetical protein